MSTNNIFTGTVKVEASIALKAALKCICFIERKRSYIFEQRVQEILDTPPIRKWYHDNYKMNWKHISKWFKSYQIVNNRQEAIKWAHYMIKWYHHVPWVTYKSNEYEYSLSLINLQHNEYIYITPQQGMIINRYNNGEYNEMDNKE